MSEQGHNHRTSDRRCEVSLEDLWLEYVDLTLHGKGDTTDRRRAILTEIMEKDLDRINEQGDSPSRAADRDEAFER